MAITSTESWIIPRNESFSVSAGQTQRFEAIDLTRADVGLNGSVITLKEVNQPMHGTVTMNVDGSYTYTPKEGYSGVDSFTYVVKDQFGNLCTQTVTINESVPTSNQSPEVMNEFAEVTSGVAISAHESILLANDRDPDGGTLSISSLGQPANGTLTRAADGTLTYTAREGYVGQDSFTYEVSDGQGGVTVGTVYLTVKPAEENRPPVVENEFASLRSGASVSAPETLLLANDSDPEGGVLTLVADGYGQPANGTLSRAADGTLTYTPKPGFVGTDSFTYKVVDAAGNTSTGTVTLEVKPGMTAPAITSIIDDVGANQGPVAAGGTTDDNRPAIMGTAEAGARVEVFDGETKIGEATADGNGQWSLTPADPLSDGARTLSVRAVAADGASASGTPYLINVNTSVPLAAPLVQLVDDANDDGYINTAESNARVDVVITLPQGAKLGDVLKVFDQDGNLTGRTLTAADIAAGKLTFADAFAMPPNGQTLTVSATVTPSGGASSPVGTDTAMVDTVAAGRPTVTLTTDTNNDGRISKAELDAAQGLDARIDLPADAKAGDKLVVTDQDGNKVERTLTAADIAAKVVVLDNAFQVAPDGRLVNLSATITDPAGNTSPVGTDSATMNLTAPTVTVNIVDDRNNDGTLTRTELSGATRVDIRIDLTPAIRVGDLIEVQDNNGHGVSKRIVQADIDAGRVTFLDAFPLPAPGADLIVTAKVTDIANNVSPISQDRVVFDGNFAPIGTDDTGTVRAFATPMLTILAMNQDSGSVVPGGQTWVTADGDAGRAVYGELSSLLTPGMKVQLSSSDNPGVWIDAVVSSDGLHWTAVDKMTHAGDWNYTARLVSASGDVLSTSAEQTVDLDDRFGGAPQILNFGTQAGNTGIALGASTTDQTLVVNGRSAEGAAGAGNTIEVFANGTRNVLGTTTVKADGSWSLDLTGTRLADGGSKYSFYAREADGAGNVSAWSNKAALTIHSADGTVENWTDFGVASTTAGYGAVVRGTLQTADGLVNVSATMGYGSAQANLTVASGLQGLFSGGVADGSERTLLQLHPSYSHTISFDKVVTNPNLLMTSVYGGLTITATRADGSTFSPTLSFVDNTPGDHPALSGINGNTVTGSANAQGVIELAGDIRSITISTGNGGYYSYVQVAQKAISGGLVLPADDGSIVPGAAPATNNNGNDTVSFSTQAALDAALRKGVDGGAGTDTLRLNGDGLRLDLTNHTSTPGEKQDVNNFEKFDLVTGTGRNALVMSVNDVLAAGRTDAFQVNGRTQVMVNGDSSDSLNLTQLLDHGGDTGTWVAAGTTVIDGITYNVFNHTALEAQVLAQRGLKVQVPAEPGTPAETTTFPTTNGNVLTNDSDPDGTVAQLRVAGVDNNPDVAEGENIGQPIAGKYGHLTVNPDGSYTYVADKSAGLTRPETDVFYYLPKDDGGANGTTPVKLTIQVDPALANISGVTGPSQGVVEGGMLEFTVATSASSMATPVTLQVVSGTGTAGVDTTGPLQANFGKGWVDVSGGTVTVPPGTTSFKVRVPTVDDAAIEPNETVSLRATSATGSTASAEATILDNDLLGNTARGTEDTPLVLKWSDFNLDNLSNAQPKVLITGLPADGNLQFNDSGTWRAVTANQELSKADIDAGKLRFTPDANESGVDAYKAPGVGNKLDDYAQVRFTAYDNSGNAYAGGRLTIDIVPVVDTVQDVTATMVQFRHPAPTGVTVPGLYSWDKYTFQFSGAASPDTDGSERNMIGITSLREARDQIYLEDGTRLLPGADGIIWVKPGTSILATSFGCGGTGSGFTYASYRQEVNSAGEVLYQKSGQSKYISYDSPLVLDLDGDGVRTTGIEQGVYFDHNNDGVAERSGWVSKGDGLLVLDRDGDGRITGGAELFGTNTVNAAGVNAAQGFEALAALDSNRDGKIDASDAQFDQLRVWRDENQDGVSQEGEMLSLGQVNVAALDLGFTMGQEIQNNNALALLGSYQTTDGKTHEMTDVFFQVDHQQTAPLLAADLLQPDSGLDAALGQAPAGATKAHAAVPVAPDVAVDMTSARLYADLRIDRMAD